MTDSPVLICVSISPLQEWFVATSKNLDDFFMTHPNLSELIKDIPNALKVLYKYKYDRNVEVRQMAYTPEEKDLFPLRYELLAA